MFYKCDIELSKLKGVSKSINLERVKEIYTSIKKEGLKYSVLIDEKYNVYLGNTRIIALKLLRKKPNYLVSCIMYSKKPIEGAQLTDEKQICKKLNMRDMKNVYGFFK